MFDFHVIWCFGIFMSDEIHSEEGKSEGNLFECLARFLFLNCLLSCESYRATHINFR